MPDNPPVYGRVMFIICLFHFQITPHRIVIRITNLINRTVHWFHIRRMKDIIDAEPEEVFIIGYTYPASRRSKRIYQRSLYRTVGIRNRRIVKVAANKDIVGVCFSDFFSYCFGLFRTDTESRS